VLRATPTGTTALPFLTGVGVAIGSATWGNEPDTWRYGQPRFGWPVPPLLLAFGVGLVLFVAGGWLMAELSGAGPYDFGPAYRYTVEYSLFGALWLGGVVATVLQVAVNDGNYYEMVNAGQNLVGHLRGWRRWHTCLLVVLVAAAATWYYPHVKDGFFTVASWSAIALPCITVVMCVDQFLLPRLGVTRSVRVIPRWRDTRVGNWPGILAVLGGVAFGAWGLGLLPGQDTAPSAGVVPVEAWALAGLLYTGLAAAAARTRVAARLLGHPRHQPSHPST
jgi:hypothetical protein